jgi:hypothetical protein
MNRTDACRLDRCVCPSSTPIAACTLTHVHADACFTSQQSFTRTPHSCINAQLSPHLHSLCMHTCNALPSCSPSCLPPSPSSARSAYTSSTSIDRLVKVLRGGGHASMVAAVRTTPSLGDAFEAARRRVDRQQMMQYRLGLLARAADEAGEKADAQRRAAEHNDAAAQSARAQRAKADADASTTSATSNSAGSALTVDTSASKSTATSLATDLTTEAHSRPQRPTPPDCS